VRIIARKARLGAFERVNPRSGIISGEIATLSGLGHFVIGQLAQSTTAATAAAALAT